MYTSNVHGITHMHNFVLNKYDYVVGAPFDADDGTCLVAFRQIERLQSWLRSWCSIDYPVEDICFWWHGVPLTAQLRIFVFGGTVVFVKAVLGFGQSQTPSIRYSMAGNFQEY